MTNAAAAHAATPTATAMPPVEQPSMPALPDHATTAERSERRLAAG
eukprot:CAMPEP_0206173952 /NCGR_PEP_ID=MMETSP1474-20131121/50667_1 /ASSEMBLY_ACC=CAM_ASM_001110 /TAXON_ID=97495 /ORGANISM="Imantonia sp., Strain RCC918" /LENGTH=45 /DNA_ID= /DNA_START= /DNA_END= /DNA_ORIENTATION=